jgi:thioredoxin reductase (NADPH)
MRNLFLLLTIFCLPFMSTHADVERVVIIGGGPSGLTSAIFAGQSRLNPLVIEGDQSDGQLSSPYKIENFPGFPEGIGRDELSQRLHLQAEIFGSRFQQEIAVAVDLSIEPFRITLSDGQEIFCDSLVIATGSGPKLLGLEGEKELLGKGISANASADAPQYQDKEVILVGGGDTAMEHALILTQYATKVSVIYKQSQFYASSYLQERVLSNPKINAIFDSEVIEIIDAAQGYISGVVLHNIKNSKESELACEGIFVANGRQPNTDMFKGQLEMSDAGYIITQPDTTKTSRPGVFAAGDIAQNAYRKAITASASGCMSAVDAAKYLKEQADGKG